MEFSKKQIIKFVVMLVFLSCTLFANTFAVRIMMGAGVDAYFYDKLLVAYTIGGAQGLKLELSKIPDTEKNRRELKLAKDFSGNLPGLADPGAFLKDKLEQSKARISLIRNLRSGALVIMLILIGWQFFIKSAARKRNQPS